MEKRLKKINNNRVEVNKCKKDKDLLPVKAEIKKHNGTSALFINGKPQFFMGFTTYFGKKKIYKRFADSGSHFYLLHVSFSGRWMSGESEDSVGNYTVPIWEAPGKYNLISLDNGMTKILEADPNAYIIIRIYLDSPRWWDNKYPEEMCLWANGERFRASIASQIWREETAKTLKHVIRYVRTAEYSNHIIGYSLTGQSTEEWFYHSYENGPDYSLPMQKAFQRYLENEYKIIKRLNHSWNSTFSSFSEIKILAKDELNKKGECLTFFSARTDTNIIDYYSFASKIMAETIRYFSKIVKEATDGMLLCGSPYGYIGRGAEPARGTNAIEDILKCPDIDTITTPTSYVEQRRIGTPWPSQGIVDSVTLAGKLWLNSSDIRTHLTRSFCEVPGFCAPDHPRYGKQQTVFNGYPDEKDGITAMRKNFCWSLCKGVNFYWNDLCGKYYDSTTYQKEITRFSVIVQESLTQDRSSVAEVAVIVGPFASTYMEKASGYLIEQAVMTQRILLSQSGVPFDEFYTFDMERMDVERYKIIFFISAWKLGRKERELIEKKFKSNGRTLVWICAVGAYGDKKEFSVKNISDITEINLESENLESFYRIGISNRDHYITKYLPGGISFGSEIPFGPIIYSIDDKANVLGEIIYINQIYKSQVYALKTPGKAGWAIKELPKWKSVYFSVPGIPSVILRRLIRYAGAHIYNSRDDILYANRNYISVFAHEEGTREIRLPGRYKVREVFSNREIGSNIDSFCDVFEEGQQKLYRLKKESP